MKSRIFVLCCSLLYIVSTFSLLEGQEKAPLKTAAIKGVARQADTKERFPYVNVFLKGTIWGMATDARGEFHITKIPPGSYIVVASVVGNKTIEQSIVLKEDQTLTLTFNFESEDVQLKEILVYGATLRKERITEAPTAVSVVEGKNLMRSASSGQLPKLIEGQPGVDLVQSGLYDFNLNTRGFNSSLNRRVLVLLDGRDLGIAFLGSTEWNGLSTPLEDLGRVEMVRGPGSALYGANAYNGVLNITSNAPRQMLGTKVTIGVGELSMYRADLRHAGEMDQFSYKINAGGVSGKTFSQTRFTSSTGNLNQDIYNAATSFDALFKVYGSQKFEYSGLTILNAEIAELRDQPVSQFYVSGRLDYDYENGGASTAEAGITQVENEVIVTGIGRVQIQRARRPFARLTYSGHGFNMNLWTSSRLNMAPEISLSTGLPLSQNSNITQGELQYSTTLLDQRLYLVGGISHKLVFIDTKESLMLLKREDNTSGIFGQAEYRFSTEFKTVFAARFDRSSVHENFISPKAAFVWSPISNHTFRATFNKAFQSPNYSELFLRVDHPFRGLIYRGNADLKVEKIQGYELGYNGVIDQTLFLTVDVYYNQLTDFVTDLGAGFNPNLTGPIPYTKKVFGTNRDTMYSHQIWSYTNAGEVNEYGYDIGVNLYATDEIILDANYSYFQFEIVKDFNKQIQPNSSRWKGNAGITYQSKDNYDVSLKVKYVPSFRWEAGVFAGDILAYTLVNLSGGYRMNQNLSFNLNITNLLDRRHYEIFGGSILGRRATFTASYLL